MGWGLARAKCGWENSLGIWEAGSRLQVAQKEGHEDRDRAGGGLEEGGMEK